MRPAAPQWRTIGGCLGILDSDLGIIQHKPALIQEGPTGYLRGDAESVVEMGPSQPSFSDS